ncbi:hypothetical protein BLOT_002120 [Blomia tropicalis]|nr:hypothetical protein BLOT_002120 [Blomia tropicalis]
MSSRSSHPCTFTLKTLDSHHLPTRQNKNIRQVYIHLEPQVIGKIINLFYTVQCQTITCYRNHQQL